MNEKKNEPQPAAAVTAEALYLAHCAALRPYSNLPHPMWHQLPPLDVEAWQAVERVANEQVWLAVERASKGSK